MDLKRTIKQVMKRWGGVTRYIPLFNRISLRGAIMATSGSVLWRTRISCFGRDNLIRLKNGCLLRNCNIYIRGNRNHVEFQSNVRAINAENWIENDGNTVTIGEGTNLCGQIHMACIEGTSIEIGRDCLCSSDIVIRTGDSHSIVDEHGRRINPSQSVMIADHVWIGHHVLINKGVRIGKNTVIGTGAVVTKDFCEDGVVLAGVPAIIVKKKINWDIERLAIENQ